MVKDKQSHGECFQVLDHSFDSILASRAFAIHIEIKRVATRGARFDVGEVHTMLCKRVQCSFQRTWLVL